MIEKNNVFPFISIFAIISLLVMLSAISPVTAIGATSVFLILTVGITNKIDFFPAFSLLMISLIASLNISGQLGVLLVGAMFLVYSFAFLVSPKYRNKNNTSKLVWFFIFWVIYALSQLIWAEQSSRTFGHMQSLIFGVAIILFMAIMINSKERFILFYKIWGFSALASIVYGIYEIITDNHLATSSAGEYSLTNIATVGFYNPNDYSLFLAISLPVMLYWIGMKNMYRLLGLFMLFSSFYIVYANGSRFILLLFFMVFTAYLFKLSRGKSKKLLAFFLLSIAIVGFFNIDVITASIEDVLTLNPGDESVGVRNYLINSAWLIFQNNILGVGAGNLEMYMPVVGYNVHNFWLEILVNYGIIVFTGLVLFFVISVYTFFKNKSTESKELTFPIYWSMIVFVPSCVVSSTIFQFPMTWFLFGTVISAISYIRNNKTNKILTVETGKQLEHMVR